MRAGLEAPAGPRRQAVIRPLLPAAARPVAWLLAVCCPVVVAVLPLLFPRTPTLDRLDRSADARIQLMYQGHDDLLRWLALPGTKIPVLALIAVIAAACLVTGRINGIVLVAAAVPAAIMATEYVLKRLVGDTVPGYLAYPSGHATGVSAIAAVLAVLMLNPRGRAPGLLLRLFAPVAAALLACAVSTAVIALHSHYFTDTVAGAAVGIGSATVTALVLDVPAARRLLALANGWLGILSPLRPRRTRRPSPPGRPGPLNGPDPG